MIAFWDRVQKTDGCWIWIGPRSPNGYGRFYPGRSKLYAHRVSFEMANGPIDDGAFVCHHCDTPLCVRPDHLFLGSHTDNMRDMWKKDRGVGGRAFGVLACHAKLTASQVVSIRAEYTRMRGQKAALARKYGVSQVTIGDILRGRTWGPEAMRGSTIAQLIETSDPSRVSTLPAPDMRDAVVFWRRSRAWFARQSSPGSLATR